MQPIFDRRSKLHNLRRSQRYKKGHQLTRSSMTHFSLFTFHFSLFTIHYSLFTFTFTTFSPIFTMAMVPEGKRAGIKVVPPLLMAVPISTPFASYCILLK